MARIVIPDTSVLLRQTNRPQDVQFITREQPLSRIARVAGIFDKLVQSPAITGAVEAGRELITGGEEARRLEAMRRMGRPTGMVATEPTPAVPATPAPAPEAAMLPMMPAAGEGPLSIRGTDADESRSIPALREDIADAEARLRFAEAQQRAVMEGLPPVIRREDVAPAAPATPMAVPAAPAVDRRMIGPKESVDARIAVLEAKPKRSFAENRELTILREQRVGETLPPAPRAMPAPRAARAPAVAVEEEFVAATPEQLYSEARLADTAEKQAAVLEKAATVFRAQPARPRNIFEALGFGRPAGADEDQLRIIAGLFPKIMTTTEKDIAAAELSRARAMALKEQAGLTGEKTESERLNRGAEQELKLAKAYKLRADALTAAEKAAAAARRGGKGKGKGAGPAIKDALKVTQDTEREFIATIRQNQNDNDVDSRIPAPGGERPRTPTGFMSKEAQRKLANAQAQYDEQLARYEAAQARIAERQAKNKELQAEVDAGREAIRGLVFEADKSEALKRSETYVGKPRAKSAAPASTPAPKSTEKPIRPF